MITEPWQYALVIAALVGNALLTYRTYRLRNRRGTADAAGSSAAAGVDPENGTVECPDCGAENEASYRYCRQCVTELPMAMAFRRDDDAPTGRLTG